MHVRNWQTFTSIKELKRVPMGKVLDSNDMPCDCRMQHGTDVHDAGSVVMTMQCASAYPNVNLA